MTQEQGRSYLVWDKGSRPFFVVKSMTRRQWYLFVSCCSVLVIVGATALNEHLGSSAGFGLIFVLLLTVPVMWYAGKHGNAKEVWMRSLTMTVVVCLLAVAIVILILLGR